MAQKLPEFRDTEASKLLNSDDDAAIQRYREQRRPHLNVNGTARDRVAPEMDRFDLTRGGTIDPTEHYNDVGPDRMTTQLRHSDFWSKHGEPDSVADFLRRIPGAKVVTDKHTGKEVREWDGVIVSYPKILHEDYVEDEQAAAVQHDGRIDDTGSDRRYTDLDEEYNPNDPREREARIRSSIQSIRDSGLAGPLSKTDGLSYSAALRTISTEDRLAEEARLRRGNRQEGHEDQLAMEAYEKRKSDLHAKGGKKTFGGLTGAKDNWTRSKDTAGAKK